MYVLNDITYIILIKMNYIYNNDKNNYDDNNNNNNENVINIKLIC